jgi:5-methylcytosine-specific restriction endonuclease McrA
MATELYEPRMADNSAALKPALTIEKKARRKMPSREEYESIVGYELWQDWYFSYYLKSSRWKKVIEPRILQRDKGLCVRCSGSADRVHHRSYEYGVIVGEADDQLASICEGCHNVIHYDDTGKRRSKDDCESFLLQKDSRNDFPPPKVDARRGIFQQGHPPGWDRMNAVQRASWRRLLGRQWAYRKIRGRSPAVVTANVIFFEMPRLQRSGDWAVGHQLQENAFIRVRGPTPSPAPP